MATWNASKTESRIAVKWSHNGEFYRFSIGGTYPEEQFTILMTKIRELQSNFNGSLVWRDEYGDAVNLSSGLELVEAISAMDRTDRPLCIFTKTTGSAPAPAYTPSEPQQPLSTSSETRKPTREDSPAQSHVSATAASSQASATAAPDDVPSSRYVRLSTRVVAAENAIKVQSKNIGDRYTMATGNDSKTESRIAVKWCHNGDFYRFSIGITYPEEQFTILMAKIRELQPDFNGSLVWKDEYGDTVNLSSGLELLEAIREIDRADTPLCIFTRAGESAKTPAAAPAPAAVPNRPQPRLSESTGTRQQTREDNLISIPPSPASATAAQSQAGHQASARAAPDDHDVPSSHCARSPTAHQMSEEFVKCFTCNGSLGGHRYAYFCERKLRKECDFIQCAACYEKRDSSNNKHEHILFRISFSRAKGKSYIESPVRCSSCQEIIQDILYNCPKCIEYDLCNRCYKENPYRHLHQMAFTWDDTANFPYLTQKGVTIHRLNGKKIPTQQEVEPQC